MSTDIISATTAGPSLRDTARVPLSRLVRVELRKMVDTRAGRWLLVAIVGLTLAAVVLFAFFGSDGDKTYWNFVGITATPQGFLLPVLGILSVTSEWSQRTGLVTFTLEPHRGRVLAAKVAAVLILGVGFVVLLLAAAAGGNVLGSSLGGDGSWAFGVGEASRVFLLQLLGLLGGLAFGVVLLNSAAAIVASFVLPLATGLLFNLVPALADSAAWIDLGTAQAALFDFQGTITRAEWLQLLVTSLWWVWIPLAAGVVRVLRAELKSA